LRLPNTFLRTFAIMGVWKEPWTPAKRIEG
jgi:hypothetical protein